MIPEVHLPAPRVWNGLIGLNSRTFTPLAFSGSKKALGVSIAPTLS